ncbi:thioredoxin family protein [Cellulophaga baltica]|nr:thioredoxin family protein [Cellulophaga baltica]
MTKQFMKQTLLILTLTFTVQFYAQTDGKTYYKDVVENCVEDLNKQINQAWADKENEKAKKLFEQLIDDCIKGKYLSNYDFKTIKKDIISTDKIDKPILLLTSATWCAPCWGEIPTLNKLAEKYDGELELIVLFWNKKKDLKKMAGKYDMRIHLIPSENEPTDKSSIMISEFNHKLDYPAAYLIDKDKKIIDLTRGAAFPSDKMTWEEANDINEKKMTEFISPIIK